MNDVIKFGKKLFTFSVVAMTLAWSLGVSALVPSVVHAEGECPVLSAGDLVKLQGQTAVFLLNSQMERLYFPNGEVYKTWYTDFSGVNNLTQTCFSAYPQTATAPYGVSYRPGSMLIKEVVSPDVYVVEPNGTKSKIASEEIASALYGSDWAKKVRDTDSAWFTTVYPQVGSTVSTAKPHNGMLIKKSDSASVYFVQDGKLHMVEGTLGAAAASVQTVLDSVFAMVEDSGTTVTKATVLDTLANFGQSVTPTPSSNVAVSLSASTPATATLPMNATHVEFTKFNVSGSGTLDTVVLHRTGVGSYDDLSNVYLYDGSTRLTSGRTVSSDGNLVTFTNVKLALSSYAKTLTVVGDLSTQAASGDQEGFEVVEVNGKTISGVAGNIMPVGSVAISAVTVDNSGTSGTFALGASEVEVGRGTINAGIATHDVLVKSIALTNAGSLSNDYLANLKLTIGSTNVATAASMTGDKVVFTLATPYSITKGDTKTFTVYADNNGGRTADTVKLYVDETSDVVVTDVQFPLYGTDLTNSFASGDQTYTVTGGDITLSNSGPAAQNIGKNVTGVTVQNFSFTSTNAVTVKNTKVWVYLTSNGTTANTSTTNLNYVKNVKIVDTDDNNRTVVGPQAAFGTGTTLDGNGYYKVFTDSFDVAAATTRHFAVVVDIDTNMPSNYTVNTVVDFSGTNYVKYANNSQYVSAATIVPNTITGNKMTVAGAQLTVSRTTPPASPLVVKGASDIEALGVLLTTGSASDLKITSMKLRVFASSSAITGNDGDTAANTAVNTVSVYEEGSSTPIFTKNLSSSSGTIGAGGYYYVQATGLSYKLSAGVSKKLIVKLGLKDTISATTYVSVDLDADDDIDVETYADGKSVTENTTATINASSPVFATISSAGSMTVAVDGNTPTANVVLSGTTNKVMSIYKFTPSKESFTLTGAKFTVDSSTKANNISKVMVSYKNLAGTTVTKECYLNDAGTCTFTDGQLDAYFPVNQTSLVTVSANFATITGGADSTEDVKLGFLRSGDTFATSTASLTNDFILLGEASNSKLYGATDVASIPAFSDTTITAQAVHKTNVSVAKITLDSQGTLAQDPVGAFTFTSEAESGSNQNSTLGTVTVKLTGSLIAGSAGNNTAAVSIYSGTTFDSAHLMGSGTITGLDTSTSTQVDIALSSNNEWTGAKTVYVVVDTTDADFVDPSSTNSSLTTQLVSYTWDDGSVTAISPVAGIPLYGSTKTY